MASLLEGASKSCLKDMDLTELISLAFKAQMKRIDEEEDKVDDEDEICAKRIEMADFLLEQQEKSIQQQEEMLEHFQYNDDSVKAFIYELRRLQRDYEIREQEFFRLLYNRMDKLFKSLKEEEDVCRMEIQIEDHILDRIETSHDDLPSSMLDQFEYLAQSKTRISEQSAMKRERLGLELDKCRVKLDAVVVRRNHRQMKMQSCNARKSMLEKRLLEDNNCNNNDESSSYHQLRMQDGDDLRIKSSFELDDVCDEGHNVLDFDKKSRPPIPTEIVVLHYVNANDVIEPLA